MSLVAQPYTADDPDRTKPSIVLVEWNGDDEETVPWDIVQGRRLAAADDDDLLPERWSGIGPRPGSIALGIVLGASLAIGALAMFLPQDAPASPLPPAAAPLTGPAWDAPSRAVPETKLVSAPNHSKTVTADYLR